MKKYISLFLCLTCILTLVACGKKAAPIQLPQTSDITSVDVTVGENTTNHSDTAWISEIISDISSSEPTSKQSVQDFPQTESYIKIDFQFETGTSTIFAYEENGKHYIEQPYQGIYKIDSQLYERLQETNQNLTYPFSGHVSGHDRFSMPSFCSSFRFQHLSHFVGGGFLCALLEKAGHDKNRVPYTDFRHAIGGCGAFHAVSDMLFFIGHRRTPFNRSSVALSGSACFVRSPCGSSRRRSRQGRTFQAVGHKSGRGACPAGSVTR